MTAGGPGGAISQMTLSGTDALRQKNWLPLISHDQEKVYLVTSVYPSFRMCELDVEMAHCEVSMMRFCVWPRCRDSGGGTAHARVARELTRVGLGSLSPSLSHTHTHTPSLTLPNPTHPNPNLGGVGVLYPKVRV